MAKTVTQNAVEAIQDAMGQLRECTAHVEGMLKACRAGGVEEYDVKLASHLSWLAKNASQCLDAMRKQEAAERARWKAMGRGEELDLVKVWLDELDQQGRAEIREHLAGLAEGGLLS
jgi:hypothetical protein